MNVRFCGSHIAPTSQWPHVQHWRGPHVAATTSVGNDAEPQAQARGPS